MLDPARVHPEPEPDPKPDADPDPSRGPIQNLACGVLEGKPAEESVEPIEPIDTAELVTKLVRVRARVRVRPA
jgi:hypothetical protein